MTRLRLAAAVSFGIAMMGGPVAQAQDSTLDDVQEEAVEGIAKLLEALQMFVKSVPQFSAPEVLPNGDIIIRRIHPDKKPAPEPQPERNDDDTSST